MNAVIISLIFLLACGHTAQRKGMEVDLDKEFQLRLGQQAALRGGALKIEFISVSEDSRCPDGVDCIWEGNAKIVVEVSGEGGARESLSLNSNTEPQSASFRCYEVRFVRLAPRPKANVSIKREEYVATLTVSKLSPPPE